MGHTYAIGDIHGRFDVLQRLLDSLEIDWAHDRLWLVGDLVNRGPDSLTVLRWALRQAKEMGERFSTVLGNHDLHLIAAADGINPERRHDTLAEILAAEDGAELVDWLRRQPFALKKGNHLLVHAGLLPEWTVAEALERAAVLSQELADPRTAAPILVRRPRAGDDDRRIRDLRRDLTVFTRLRTMTEEGKICPFAGPPEGAPTGCRPWFELEHRRPRELTVIAGHWAALGVRQVDGLIALDAGCAWGKELSAIRLEDRHITSVAAG